jgi:hypothetical protein
VDRIDFAKLVIARRASAMNVPFKKVELLGAPGEAPRGPRFNSCHDNVRDWLFQNPNHKAVPGYLLDDLSSGRCVVHAHSVVQREDGSLFDITPMHVPKSYPFVGHIGTPEEFDAMKGHEGIEVKDAAMDKHLLSMWTEINKEYFGGELQPLAAIDWEETSGSEGIGAHGVFFFKSNCIVIDKKFRFDEEAIRAGNKEEKGKLECAYRLLMHEMVHQASYQKEAPQPGRHGESFLAEAERISKQMGLEVPTAENVHQWPFRAPKSASEA